jgi:APA family basic amino acid/polyamine antiporter
MIRRSWSSLFARKPVETLLSEMEDSHRLHRALGPVSLTALGVGATIGTGLFVLTGEAAVADAGPSIMLSFVLAAIGCGFAALCYAELASMVPVAGSAYTYAYTTLGEIVAWIIGWDLVLEYAISCAATASGWSNYLAQVFRSLFGITMDSRLLTAPWDFDTETGKFFMKKVAIVSPEGPIQMVNAWFNLPAMFIILFLTAILVVGIRESAGFNTAMVLLDIGIILTIIGVGFQYVDPQNWTHPFLHAERGWSGVALGAGQIFYSYIGFDSISTHAEEARRPQRDMPIGIFCALVICTLLYVGAAAVLTGMVPYQEIDIKAPFATAFERVGLTRFSGLVALGIVVAMTSVMLVGLLSQARIFLAMARDGMLPPGLFAAIHPRFKTPWKSTILLGLTVGLAAALAPLKFLAELVSIGTLFAFIIVCASVWLLRWRRPELKRPFRAPMLPLVASLGILVNLGLMISLRLENWVRLLVWLLIGLVIYFVYSHRHTRFCGEVGDPRPRLAIPRDVDVPAK